MTNLPFDISSLAPSANIWGPPSTVPESLRFGDIPYAPYSKGDKLGKAADWPDEQQNKDNKQQLKKTRDYFQAYGDNDAASFAADGTNDGESFEVVDSQKSTSTVRNNNAQAQTTILKGRRLQNGRQVNNRQNNNNQNNNQNNNNQQWKPQNRRQNWKEDNQRTREFSVKVEDSWKVISDIEFHKLTKLNFEVDDGEELGTYGSVNVYNKKIERSAGVPLKAIDKVFYNPTASEDPVIQQFKADKVATVYTTDSVITQLMCATRSVYSWDIVVTKKDGVISFDKRENSNIDRVTVGENSQDAPSDVHDSNINNVDNLALEATYINQNFLANSVLEESSISLSKPNPFHGESKETLLSKGYKYKRFVLRKNEEEENPTSILIRTEFDSKDANQILNIKAINEYQTTSLDWKTKFNSQRGAIIASELKNNNNKFSKWTNQAILAGVDSIKLGFVTRTNFKDNKKHTIIGVTSYSPRALAQQINLSTGNGWGIIKSYIDIISAEDDGKFVILKNPNTPKLTLYKVPENTFQDE